MSKRVAMQYPHAGISSQSEGELARSSGAEPSLEWLLSPVGKKSFFADYWEKKPLVVQRRQQNYFSSLLSLDEVDRVLTTLDRRYPDVTLKNATGRVSGDDYTLDDDSLDVARVYQLFGEGSTITLAYLDTVIPALASLCRSLEREFSSPFQANVYLTPPRAQGAKHHYDTHDVLVLQVAGTKQWIIYGTPVELPLRGQDFDASIHAQGTPTLEFKLEPGDMAYIPRGVVHDARSTDEVSLHITVGILSYTWTDLLLELLADVCVHDPAFRKALPPGFARNEFDRAPARETLGKLLKKASAQSSLDVTLDRFVDEFVSACPPLLRGQMAQMAKLDCLRLDSVVGVRTGVLSLVRASAESVAIECFGRTIIFPFHAGEAVRFALSKSEFVVRDLPGDLDVAGKLALVRRLIQEGLMVARKV
ncbi:MAG TPA: cupin domain-containing protein [Terriglobia bacterium]|nr:cupin domain-containing protein [Terriglobia bacterium]